MVANTAALLAKYSDAVCFVNHDGAVVLVLQLDNLGEFGEVALH